MSGSAGARAAGLRLATEARGAEAWSALEESGARPILIKGAAVAHRLYRVPEERRYVDVDLLVDPSRRSEAEAALRGLGLSADRTRRRPDASGGRAWSDPNGGPPVDLHVRLPFVGAPSERAFSVLIERCEKLALLDAEVRILTPAAMGLNLALHAAQDGPGFNRPGRDLARAIATYEPSLWEVTAALARELDATDALSAGLGLATGGPELARRLRLGPSRSFAVNLCVAGLPPLGDVWISVAAEERLADRIRLLRERILPARGRAISEHGPRAGGGRSSALLAYAWFPFEKLFALPRTIGAFARAFIVTRRARRSG